jgi:ABC-type phosphate/phosphonate transport system substrate-binding protein
MEHTKISSVQSLILRKFALIALLFICTSVQAELILTAPPRENAEAGQAQYGPLAAHLSKLLGEKVVYQQPKGWLYYQRDMRHDKFDIVFDGPHFMSWRIKQFDHTPVAKLPGQLSFIIITDKNNLEIEKVDDLVNIKVCAIAPPNLSTMTVLGELDNPARQPMLVTVKGGMKGVYKSFKEGKCEAAILRDKFFAKKIPEEERVSLKTVFKSIPVSNQGITVSSRISPEQRAMLASELTKINIGTQPTLKRFAGKAEKMLPASFEEYDAQHKLLTGVVFGWEITNSKVQTAQTTQ